LSPTAEAISSQDHFAPISTPDSLRRNPQVQSLDHSALAKVEAKLHDAKNLLAQQLLFRDWRAALEPDSKPAGNSTTTTGSVPTTAAASEIPLPRSRPAAADVQLAAT